MANTEEKKSPAEILAKQLVFKKEHLGKTLSAEQLAEVQAFGEGYKKFLDEGKTERRAAAAAEKMLVSAGFVPFDRKKKYVPGDRIFQRNRGKAIIAAVVGSQSLELGVNIMAAHIDSPRVDLKQVPLYESGELAYFKTHYYGGIKKYQWPTVPLALHGVICKNDGSAIDVNIGEDDNDPIFVITDLLPHLAAEQYKRPANKLIAGEELNILIGSLPFKDEKGSELVKLNILKLLNEKYGITEADFLSAELECVPNYKARDIGFDRSMIGAYGQDDRVCAYTALKATIDAVKIPDKTIVTVLTDKEETGSDGNTGLNSDYLRYFIADLAEPHGFQPRHVLSASLCLSADVNAAFDPTFPDVLEKQNASYVNYGVVITKFTGRGGKGGTSDASAETVGRVRRLFDENGVVWQTGELGKVDLGGGGTVALYIANMNVDTIDVGVPILAMHAPLEIAAKTDIYMTYKAFLALANS